MKKLAIIIPLLFLLAACYGDTQNAQTDRTQTNLDQINANQPVPNITYSQRLQVLYSYYGQVLNKPRLRTCTMITSRGSGGSDVIGLADSLGMPVNLSNQSTAPTDTSGHPQPEPDGIYPGNNDQTAVVFRNGRALVTEADTTAITGDCAPGLKPSTIMQKEIDYIESLPPAAKGDPNNVNFCAESHC